MVEEELRRIIYSDPTVDEMCFAIECYWWKEYSIRIHPEMIFRMNKSLTAAKIIVHMYQKVKNFYRGKFENAFD